ncbi:nucleoside triphosphate pyrophosphohydrolase [Halobacillus litoralis]|uniref:nucleoside triphosphate pyrophosphohydrolase n=1 Tax=Halobacillus litoralis TaxID=45668 RepID=UPI001CFD3BA5|nr:nucleoside triphosphate pyrophosphohydrolase [Halobacillus litoralis]WLR47496.1 nucleoside triphosphate pyrophosphohydrolase [Halobacillus litoralis]
MTKHNKLVRDHIPNLLRDSGKNIRTRTLNKKEYDDSLKHKLKDEVEEYFNTDENKDSLTKLADLLEVIHALSYTHGATIEELEHIRQHRRKERGAFFNRTMLLDIEDE